MAAMMGTEAPPPATREPLVIRATEQKKRAFSRDLRHPWFDWVFDRGSVGSARWVGSPKATRQRCEICAICG